MILDQAFPPDIRVENESITLAQNGHDVQILNFTHDKDMGKTDSYHGVKIHRLYKNKRWIKRGRALINTIVDYYTPYWAKQITNFIEKSKIEILHVHDLYMLGAAYKANKRFNLRIIADLHENYVDGLNYYEFANSFPGNIVISKKKWARKEIEWCKKADQIITVIEEAAIRYEQLGICPDKITVVANYVNYDHFLKDPDDPEIISRFQNNFVATYIGGFDYHRGIESVIRAVPAVIRDIPNFILLLVGSGRNIGDLKALSQHLNIADKISFEGFRPSAKIPSYIKSSSVCLIPHLKTTHTDNTIPHKLFHYMLLEKPVIATDCDPIKRILSETHAGTIYKSGNELELTKKLVELYNNQELMIKMGQCGKKAVRTKYQWNFTANNLLKLYRDLEVSVG